MVDRRVKGNFTTQICTNPDRWGQRLITAGYRNESPASGLGAVAYLGVAMGDITTNDYK